MVETLFVTNRPNYCHKRFAEAVKARFFYVKHPIPDGIPGLSLVLNGFVNSRSLPDSDVFFSESLMDFYPVYYKNPRGKKIVLIAEDTLFKLEKMQQFKKGYILRMLERADGFIAISGLCKKLLMKYTDKPAKIVYPFPHKEFFHVKSNIDSKNILFIGRGDKTKGFPELVKAVKILREKDPEWKFYLIGGCSDSVASEDGIVPLGLVNRMEPYFARCSLHVHPSIFDLCPATVFETMNSGMIPIISKNVGQEEIFREEKLEKLILDSISPERIAAKILEVHSMDKKVLSRKSKKLSMKFREKDRLKMFKKEFKKLLNDSK